MLANVDDVDRKILELLQADARTPLAAIAKAIGLSGAAVSERVRKLETSGVIRGYTVIVDSEKLGKPLTAFIRVTQGATHSADIGPGSPAAALVDEPDVLEIHHIAGEDCYMLKVRAASPRGIETLLNRLRARMDIARTVTSIVLSTVKEDGRPVAEEDESG